MKKSENQNEKLQAAGCAALRKICDEDLHTVVPPIRPRADSAPEP
jgi:hypothetical protein